MEKALGSLKKKLVDRLVRFQLTHPDIHPIPRLGGVPPKSYVLITPETRI